MNLDHAAVFNCLRHLLHTYRVAGHRPPVSALVVLTAVIAFFGLAIVKPWGTEAAPAIALVAHVEPPEDPELHPASFPQITVTRSLARN